MDPSNTCDVLIVGAGPVGATLALLLAREGASVILADLSAGIYPLPRAAHIDHETVRVFQAVGAAEAVMAASRVAGRYDFLSASGEVLMRFGGGAGGSPSGWPAANMIHQPSLEAALRERFAGAAGIDFRTQWALADYAASDEGVRARFATPSGEAAVGARYMVGCDGASSTVRERAGVTLEDLDFDEPWLVIDAIVEDASRLPDANLQICDPVRPTTCVQMGAGRHRWEFMLRPDETAEQALDDGFIADLLKPWNVEGAVRLERKAVYRFHALIAREWRKGRVLLAGDAAHQTPPFAGQGLCAGVRDVANLAWKLGAVVRGEAGEGLLDTYQIERAPHVRHVIELALMMGRMVCTTDAEAAAARDAELLARRAADQEGDRGFSFPPIAAGCLMAGAPGAGEYFPQPWAGSAEAAQRLDDVAGKGPWLIQAQPSPSAWGVDALALTEARMAPFAAELARWMDAREAEAVLVRPDRYVFGAGPAAVLAKAWAEAVRAGGLGKR